MSPDNDEILISQAALILGVANVTLRTWDMVGHLVPRRRKHNGYRVYSRKQLEDYKKNQYLKV